MIINRTHSKLKKILNRGDLLEGEYLKTVVSILEDVKINGDKAVLEYTQKFDYQTATLDNIQVPTNEIDAAWDSLPSKMKSVLINAKNRIEKFHEKQLEKSWFYEEDGVLLGQKITPIERVGVYVPGGKASYPSSVLMNVIPAKVAGVKEIVMVNPTPNNEIDQTVLAAAKLAGVDKIYRIGGAQAVAALAYGTATIPKVDKIVGPGNIYVALAKKMVFGKVDIDMIAGPSEILVIADESANPAWVAADMLSQAEHDELASAIAVVTSKELAVMIEKEIYEQMAELPRKHIAEKSIANFSAIIVVKNLIEACEIANQIAPEHLELCVDNPMELLRYIKNAGAIFMGHYTPEAAGDYYAGPNHVLPTGGSARFFSPLGVYDFCKRSSMIYYSEDALRDSCKDIALFAKSEQLTAHARSAEIRFKK